MSMLAILVMAFSILGFTALASVLKLGLAGPLNSGPHGFSEILYAFSSATGNNGSAFAGLTANTVFYNTTLGFAMLIGRFLFIVPMMAVAGSLAAKKIVPAFGRHLSHPWRIVCRAFDRRHPDRGRADFLPGAVAWPHRRTSGDAGRHFLLRNQDDQTSARLSKHGFGHPVPAIGGAFKKLDPRAMAQQSGDVRGGSDRHPDHLPVPARLLHGGRIWVLPSRSISGCGSPSCSPISRKRWRRGAARPRPKPCAAPAPTPSPRCWRIRPPKSIPRSRPSFGARRFGVGGAGRHYPLRRRSGGRGGQRG